MIIFASPDEAILSVRALAPRDLPVQAPNAIDFGAIIPLLPLMSDLSLVNLWAVGMTYRDQSMIYKALCVAGLWQRYRGYGDGFAPRAADLIRQITGRSVSTAAIYRAAYEGIALQSSDDPESDMELLGHTVLAIAGRCDDPRVAMERAVALRLAGRNKTETGRLLLDGHNGPSESEDRCTDGHLPYCSRCGKRLDNDV